MKTYTPKQEFLKQVRRSWPVAKGSLREVRKSCSQPGCKACAEGVKHPAWLFTYRKDGKLHSLHVPREMAPTVRQAIENGRKLEQMLVDAGVELIRERPRS